MEASKKFRLKRLTKNLQIIGYSCLIFFVLFLVGSLIIRSNSEGEWSTTIAILIAIGLLGSLMASGIILIVAGMYQQELKQYKYNIQVYRARNFAYRTIEHLQHGELQQAIDEYIKCNRYPEKSIDDLLYGMLIQACYLSSDDKLKEKGVERINNLKNRFNPDKIIFN